MTRKAPEMALVISASGGLVVTQQPLCDHHSPERDSFMALTWGPSHRLTR